MTSQFPSTHFAGYVGEESYGNASPPIELRQPTPRRAYPALAPNPDGLKRKRDDDERSEPMMTHININKVKKPRKASLVANELSEEDRYLVQLKEDDNLPWKDIASRFQTEKGKTHQVAALQMRYKRLRERFRVWEDQDVQALQRAHEYWEHHKWEIISQKVSKHYHAINDFGLQLTRGLIDARVPKCPRKMARQALSAKVAGGRGRHRTAHGHIRHDTRLHRAIFQPDGGPASPFWLHASTLTIWQQPATYEYGLHMTTSLIPPSTTSCLQTEPAR
jgi:hypothetical protein